MKKRGLLAVLVMGILLSSCGIMKNNDFSSRKYTHFKKGEAVVVNNPVRKEKVTVSDNVPVDQVVIKTEDRNASVSENTIAPSQTVNKPEIAVAAKQNNVKTASLIKKEKIQRTMNLLTDRLINKGSTASVEQYSTLLLVILAILIPPLAVYLARGAHTDFWIDLILALLGLSVLANPLFGVAYLIAIIYALVIVLK